MNKGVISICVLLACCNVAGAQSSKTRFGDDEKIAAISCIYQQTILQIARHSKELDESEIAYACQRKVVGWNWSPPLRGLGGAMPGSQAPASQRQNSRVNRAKSAESRAEEERRKFVQTYVDDAKATFQEAITLGESQRQNP